jgi:hypothetical protein
MQYKNAVDGYLGCTLNAVRGVGDDNSKSKKLRGRALLLLVSLLYIMLNITLWGIYTTEGPPGCKRPEPGEAVPESGRVCARIPCILVEWDNNNNNCYGIVVVRGIWLGSWMAIDEQ